MTAPSMPALLAERFPPLRAYCPILDTVSAPQSIFLLSDAREALYGGAVGGGKSAALLMAALQYVDVRGYAALLLRRSYAELSKAGGLIPLSHEWLSGTDARWNEQAKRWSFPSGATLEFGYLDAAADVYRYQGAAFGFVGFDEATHFEEAAYEYVGFSRQRRRKLGAAGKVPVRTRATANPGGVGHAWVKRRFIDERAADVLFVPAKVRDNPGLDAADYESSLAYLPLSTRKQLMDGDWTVVAGAAYPEWDESIHVVAPFAVPSSWDRSECMDFGVSNPTAWLLVAQDYDGNLVVADSIYGPNRGPDGRPRGGLSSETAPIVLARRLAWWEPRGDDGWKTSTNRVWADPSIRNTVGIANQMGQRTSVMQELTDLGVGGLTPANNDRRAGYLRLRELVKPNPEHRFPAWHPRAGELGSPRLFVFSTCSELIGQLQSAQLESGGERLAGEAVDADQESAHLHAHAALRYLALSRPGASREPEQEITDPRAAFLARRRRERAELRDRINRNPALAVTLDFGDLEEL